MKKTNTIKRILSLALALLMVFSMMPRITLGASAVNMTGGEKLYLKPNANWKSDNARFAAYFFGSSNRWVDMTKVAGETDLYEVTAPSGNWTNVIFCRMTPSASANNWSNKWNQTGDLTYDGTNNLFTVPAGVWDVGTTGWSVYTPPVPETEPPATQAPATEAPATEAPATEAPAVENVTVYAINSMRWGTVCAYVWDVNPYVAWPGAAMTKTGETVNGFDVYSYTFPETCVSIIFNNNAGVQTADMTVKAGQYYDIKGGEWYASLSDVPAVDTSSTSVYLVGEFNGWSTIANEFRKSAEGDTVAKATLTLAADTAYRYKIVNSGVWTSTSTAITDDASGIKFSESVGSDAKITTKAAGEYVFTYDLTANTLSVSYPEASTEPVPTEPEAPAEPNAENTTGALLNLFCRTVEDHAALQLGFHPDFCTVLETGYDAGEEYFWADVQVSAKNYAEYAAGQNSAFAGHTMDEMDEEIFTITFKWNGSAWIPSGTQDVSFTCVPAEPAGKQYALFGWINGADYGCEDDRENIGEYIFVDGKLTVTFTSVSYVAVKTTDNATWYMTDGWAGEATSVTLYDPDLMHIQADKLMVPGGVELTFTLVENADGTLTLSYSDGSEDEEPTEPPAQDDPNTYTIYFQNNWNWSDVRIYFWGSATVEMPVYPGIAMEKFGNDGIYDIYTYDVPADITGMIITGDNGTNKSPDIMEGFYNGICYYMLWNNGNAVGSEDISVILPGTEVKPDPTPDPEPDPTDPKPDPDAFIIYFNPNGVAYERLYVHTDSCAHALESNKWRSLQWDEELALWVSDDLSALICNECEPTFEISTDVNAQNVLVNGILEKGKTYVGPAPTEPEPADYVLQVGDEKFEASQLKDAFTAANNGGTVEVLKDFTLSEFAQVAYVDDVTLNLNGYTITLANALSVASSTVTINAGNGGMAATDINNYLDIGHESNVVLNGGTYGAIHVNGTAELHGTHMEAGAFIANSTGKFYEGASLGQNAWTYYSLNGAFGGAATFILEEGCEWVAVGANYVLTKTAVAPTISADDVQKAFTVHVQADCGGLTGKHSDFVQLGEVTENDGVYTCVVTIQAKDFAEYNTEDFDILWPKCAPHSADPENPETIEVTLTWDAENQKWTAAEEDQHIYLYILCAEPAPTISADDVQKAFTVHLQSDCDLIGSDHSDFVQLGEVTENDGVYTCVVTILAKDFAEDSTYDFDFLDPECAPHSADPETPETIEVTLTWDAENQKWTAAEEDQHIFVYILCADNSPQPTFVAQIGEITYETLADAFNAAESGDVIKLLSDDCINETDIPEGVVLDLNGHKLAITNTPFTGRISFNGGSLIPAAAPTAEMIGPNGMIMKTTDGIIDLTELNMILVGGTFTMSAAGGVVLVAGTAKLIVPDDYTINLSCILNSADASIVGPADMDVVTELAGYTVVYANGTYTLALSDEVVKIYIEYHDEPVIPGLTAADDDYLYYVEVAAGEDLVLTMPEAKGIFVLETYNSEDDSYTTTNSKADGTVTMPWEVISDEGVEYLWLAHYPNKVTVNLNGGSLSDETLSWFYDYGGELAEDGKSATMYYPIHNWIMLEYELEWSTFVKEGCTLIGYRLNGGTEIVDEYECVDGLVVDLVWKGGCEAMIWGEAFETLEKAIEAAEKGDIVRLCADVSVDELALFNGIILDLDGHTLDVAKYTTVYADNHIVDYEGGGLLKSKYVMIDDGNSALPIWDEARGGYIFVRTSDFKLQVEELSENSTKCVFLPYLSEEAYALLAQGMETSGAALKIEVFWERADGKMASIIFCFTDDLMAQFAEKYPTADRKAFSLTLTGTADKKISYRVFFESVTGVEYECSQPK